MKRTTNTIGQIIIIANCLLILALYSCKNNNSTTSNTKCADSTATVTKTTSTTDTSAATSNNDSSNVSDNMNGANNISSQNKKNKRTGNGINNSEMNNEPTGPVRLDVTSSAFENLGVIPIKYTCDGSGVTPPLKVTNIPNGTQSLTLIVHDYQDAPGKGRTFWLIWNLDNYGIIPENFHNNHEGMNAANEYGNTPLCSKSGNHKYHFIVYALDTKLVMGKNSTKSMIENVMRGHVLGKGELIGIYNKQLQ